MVVFQLSNCNAYIINKCKGKRKKVEGKKTKQNLQAISHNSSMAETTSGLNPNPTLWSVTTAFTNL